MALNWFSLRRTGADRRTPVPDTGRVSETCKFASLSWSVSRNSANFSNGPNYRQVSPSIAGGFMCIAACMVLFETPGIPNYRN